MMLDRRTLLVEALRIGRIALAGGLPLAMPLATGCSRPDTICYDRELFSTPERSLRDSQGYADVSPYGESRECSGCQFFRAAGKEGCGECQILAGPVRAGGHCNAWAARALG